MVPVAEISDAKNDYNLNLPRYIDSTDAEDLQDIEGHLRGGIPNRDLDALHAYWQVIPSVRAALFEDLRPGYSQLRIAKSEIKPIIYGHPEFTAFNAKATELIDHWKSANTPHLKGLDKDGLPKALIETISASLLQTFQQAPLVDAYDVYQHLLDYWAESMQDDCYIIAGNGWFRGAQPREIFKVQDKNKKMVWSESHDYLKGKRRFKSDLIPAPILIARYFINERDSIDSLEANLVDIEQQLQEMMEENGGDEGLLVEVIEGDGDKQKITAKAIKARLKEIGKDAEYVDEGKALKDYSELLDKQTDCKAKLKAAIEDLDAKVDAKYPKLTEAEIKSLVVDDKWIATLATAVQGELDRVSQTLTGRIRELAERYESPLPQIVDEVAALSAKVDEHLKKMGVTWK